MNRRAKAAIVGGACLALIGLAGCQSSSTSSTTAAPTTAGGLDAEGCITSFDANKDYFPDKVTFDDAKNVTVDYQKSYKVVTVKEPVPGGAPETYVLVQCGAPEPQLDGDLAKAEKITVPAKRIVSGSTTHVAGYELMDAVDHLVGISGADKVSDGPTRDAVQAGRIADVKKDGMSMSVEAVAATKPDVVIHGGTDDPAFEKLKELGIPVVADAEWLENSPLGRSEWTKYTALSLNTEAKANEVYGTIKTDYEAVATKARAAKDKPTTLAGSLNKGIYYAPGNEGYAIEMIRDAGAEYVLADDAKGTGSVQLGLEVVLGKGADATYWVNGITGTPKTTADVLQADPRLGELTSVKEGHVWNYTRKINSAGGNGYWQSGVVRPDLVLGDLVAIFHPGLMPEHEFVYYENVAKA